MINSEEINFLCGKETLKNWKIMVDMRDDKLEFKQQQKSVELMESDGGHHLARL